MYKLLPGVPEPLSREALRRLREWPSEADGLALPHMATESFKRIRYELMRYCRGEIDGISVLIAGQRGAGKTTLAKLAIQDVMRDSEALIPLPLILHGPTIIDPDANTDPSTDGSAREAKPATAAEASDPRSPANDAQSTDADTTGAKPSQPPTPAEVKWQALRQIITALYRHLQAAFYEAWLNAASESPNVRRARRELLELRSHLDLRLDRAPTPDTLRKIWARAGFLHSGVAFYLRRAEFDPVRKRARRRAETPKIAGDADDQGLREIIALATCADAYRVILGRTTEKQQSTDAASQTLQRSLPAELPAPAAGGTGGSEESSKSAAEKLAPPVLGTLAGGLTLFGGGLSTSLLALAVGGLVGILSWLASSYVVQKQSSRDTRRELTTDVDWSVKRLERDLPVLLRRVNDAGFAPIFVLDELDKMRDAMTKLDDFLRLVKHIVTDQAAFLFLTHRDYYERLNAVEQLVTPEQRTRERSKSAEPSRQTTPGMTNPVATTFYTHRIFVIYEPDDYRRYLLRMVDQRHWAEEEGLPRKLGLMAWGTILVYRSRMLPFDFNRRLKRLVNEKGEFFDQNPSLPLSRTVYRQELAMQLGIEVITRRPDVQERIKEVPYFSQLIYDTLYLPSFRHEQGTGAGQPFEVTAPVLRKYLWLRGRGDEHAEEMENFPPDEVVDYLLDVLERYLSLLEAPSRIKNETINYANQLPRDSEEHHLWLGLAEAIDPRPLALLRQAS
jgi:hypothetical protein